MCRSVMYHVLYLVMHMVVYAFMCRAVYIVIHTSHIGLYAVVCRVRQLVIYIGMYIVIYIVI